jgi:hypothetical protein
MDEEQHKGPGQLERTPGICDQCKRIFGPLRTVLGLENLAVLSRVWWSWQYLDVWAWSVHRVSEQYVSQHLHAIVSRIRNPMPRIRNRMYRTKCLWLFTATQLSTQGQWLRQIVSLQSVEQLFPIGNLLTGLRAQCNVHSAYNAYFAKACVSYIMYRNAAR